MSRYDDDGRVDAHELVERFWPYDGPYTAEQSVAAAEMITRLVRYLNNATQKPAGLPHAATVGAVLVAVAGETFGHEQLLRQLAGVLDRKAIADPSLYDDRRDRPGAVTAQEAARRVRATAPSFQAVATFLAEAAGLASHLGSGS